MHAKPFWRACFAFCNQVLGAPQISDPVRAIAFGIHGGANLLGEAPRALLRHAFGAYYADATKVLKENTVLIWQHTFYRTLINFRSAVLRYGHRIGLHHNRRIFTNLVAIVPQTDRERFAALIDIQQNGVNHLTSAFTTAIDNAKKAADARAANH